MPEGILIEVDKYHHAAATATVAIGGLEGSAHQIRWEIPWGLL
jgi:hypothetical protein